MTIKLTVHGRCIHAPNKLVGKSIDGFTECVDVGRELGYDKNAEEMTIVVTPLLFL